MSNKSKLNHYNNVIKVYFDKNKKTKCNIQQYNTDFLLNICYLKDYTMRTIGKFDLEEKLRNEVFTKITANHNSSQVLKYIVINKSFSDYIGHPGEKYQGSILFHIPEISLESKISIQEIMVSLGLLEAQNYIKFFKIKGIENIVECLVNKEIIIKNIKKLQQGN